MAAGTREAESERSDESIRMQQNYLARVRVDIGFVRPREQLLRIVCVSQNNQY